MRPLQKARLGVDIHVVGVSTARWSDDALDDLLHGHAGPGSSCVDEASLRGQFAVSLACVPKSHRFSCPPIGFLRTRPDELVRSDGGFEISADSTTPVGDGKLLVVAIPCPWEVTPESLSYCADARGAEATRLSKLLLTCDGILVGYIVPPQVG
jgi:hypothetical protein